MKAPWCLAASTPTASTRSLIDYDAKRWGIESAFRDAKDLRFGMGMSATRISSPERRDRLWLLKANTVKTRTHSLFRQECMLDDLTPTMLDDRLRPRMQRFGEIMLEHHLFSQVSGLA